MVVVAALAWGASTGCSLAQGDQAVIKRGETLMTRHCASCHAVGVNDSSPRAEAPPFRTLSSRYPIDALEEALGEGMVSGHPDMPELQFSATDVGAIIAYLKSIQTH
jgi:mono/diheme cytochrome c family protein